METGTVSPPDVITVPNPIIVPGPFNPGFEPPLYVGLVVILAVSSVMPTGRENRYSPLPDVPAEVCAKA